MNQLLLLGAALRGATGGAVAQVVDRRSAGRYTRTAIVLHFVAGLLAGLIALRVAGVVWHSSGGRPELWRRM